MGSIRLFLSQTAIKNYWKRLISGGNVDRIFIWKLSVFRFSKKERLMNTIKRISS